MKTIYFDCSMGAAGDMIAAALLELHPDPASFIKRMNALGIPGVRVSAEKSVKCGITGTHINVTVHGGEEQSEDVHTGETDHHGETGHEHSHEHAHEHPHEHAHEHRGLHEIEHIIDALAVSQNAKEHVLAVYRLIAEAESKVHGVPAGEVHFHEVGSMDAVADITAVCLLIEELSPDRILASPVQAGSGQVRCAHGILPVPAPATARILEGIPFYSGAVRGELCTPTGAALLKHFVQSFGPMPVLTVQKTGYGMGKKDFEAANCLRVFLAESCSPAAMEDGGRDEISELICSLDDMSGESLAFAQQLLLDSGALDAYVIPAVMKKNRAGYILTCLCRKENADKMAGIIFKHTTTLGIREYTSTRRILSRHEKSAETEYGTIRIKTAEGYGTVKSKPEYEDLAKIAREHNISLKEAASSIK